MSEERSVSHPWRWRLVVGCAMFLLALIGVLLTAVQKDRSWDYWRVLAVLFALMSLGLSLYLKKKKTSDSLGTTLWHEVLHWTALFFSIFFLSLIVKLGIVAPFAASLIALLLLALATFLAGVYIERTFLFVGGVMGFFALMLSYVSFYSYLFLIPLCVLLFLSFVWFVRYKHRQEKKED